MEICVDLSCRVSAVMGEEEARALNGVTGL